MGGVWSKAPNHVPAPLPQPPSSSVLKRKRPSDSTRIPPNSSLTITQNSSSPSIDATPDGEMHRYIVRCSAVFWCTRKDISRILSKLENMPPYGALHKIPKWDHFFITFPNSNCAQLGVAQLNAYKYRGEPWCATMVAEQSAKRMRVDEEGKRGRGSGGGRNLVEGVCLTAADVTAKFRGVAYEEQIRRKRSKWNSSLSLVTKNMKKELRGKGSVDWVDEVMSKVEKGNPVCCPLVGVVEAEEEEARMYYRNKNEFTVGFSPDCCGMHHDWHKKEITVGYAMGMVKDGQVFVGEVNEDCVTTGETAREVARCLLPVIKASGLEPYDKRGHDGYWRQITCREGRRTGHVIVSIVVNPNNVEKVQRSEGRKVFSDRECQDAVVKALYEYFGDKKEFGVFWQPTDHVSAPSGDIPAVRLHGIDAFCEKMCGLQFRVQPTAFFQVNTVMAEKLYNLIGDLANVSKETALFDVCCGTGTIGLSLARRAHSVVGIEMNESAIADAEYNAKQNGITNATFIAGKVEDRIYDAIKQVDGSRECVAILDPPRAGLPMNVVAAVRGMRAVRRIVYVACEPNNFWRNALGFCRPRSKAFKLEPFRPVKAYGLDLFPHTDHGELAILLERDVVDIQSTQNGKAT